MCVLEFLFWVASFLMIIFLIVELVRLYQKHKARKTELKFFMGRQVVARKEVEELYKQPTWPAGEREKCISNNRKASFNTDHVSTPAPDYNFDVGSSDCGSSDSGSSCSSGD